MFSLALATPSSAQSTCTPSVGQLTLERIARLSDSNGEAGLARPLLVQRASREGYLVVTLQRQGTLLLFEDNGGFARSVGTVGQGPQEFLGILAVEPGVADSIHVLDGGNHRMSVLTPSLTVARTMRLPVSGSSWFGVLRDGSTLMMSPIPRRGGERLHLLDASGALVRSFFYSPPVGPENAVSSLRRRMSVTSQGIIALSHADVPAVEIWDASGSENRTVQFEAFDRSQGEPLSIQERAWVDDNGKVWTVTHVADPNWAAALSSAPRRDGRDAARLLEENMDRLYDSVVRVVDLSSGLEEACLRVDQALTLFSSDGFAWSYREDAVGFPHIDVWRLSYIL